MSAAFAAGAISYPGAAVIMIWAAISFGCVALGYGGLGIRIFGRTADGRISWPSKILLLPYLLYSWIIWHLCRVVIREDAYNRIDDNLVIGRRLLAKEIPDGFDHYVDLTAEFEDPPSIRSRKSYRSFPILDASVPFEEDLEQAADAVKTGKAYVHCAQGHGRTGLFALALLIHRGRIETIDEGIALLKSLRPALNLNREQVCFIERYLQRKQPKTHHRAGEANHPR